MKSKLLLFKKNLQNGKVTHFPSLRITDENIQFCKEKMKLFAQNVQHVHEEMEMRFFEFADLSSSIKLLCSPFDISVSNCHQEDNETRAKFQIELLQLQCDTVLQNKVPQQDTNGNYSASFALLKEASTRKAFIYETCSQLNYINVQLDISM